MCCAYIFVVWIGMMIVGILNHLWDYLTNRRDPDNGYNGMM